jgi:hypothetical protein
MNIEMAVAAVSMKTALKYRRDWNKKSPAVKALQKMMPAGPGKLGYRLYIPIGAQIKHRFVIPPAVRYALKKNGFVATDYLAKKCVKLTDKDQKNVFNIGKVIAKDEHAKAAFDNDPQLQNSASGAHMQVVISCHPYDIIGMSTGRSWDKHSCMRLDDGVVNKGDKGAYSRHVKNDVAEGTLVAYAIDPNDTNISKPKCRCLIKPFVNSEGDVLYRRETDIYGNPVPGFNSTVNAFIRKLNADAESGHYEMSGDLYDDGAGHDYHHVKSDSNRITNDDVADDHSLAVDFIKQEMEIIHAGQDDEITNSGNISGARRNADNIAHMLNDLSSNELTAQLDEIADLVRGSSFVAQYVSDLALHGKKINSALAYVARKANLLSDRKNIKFPDTLDPKLALTQARSGNLAALEVVLRTLDDESNPDDHHPQIIADMMYGVLPIPEKEMLDKYHYAKSVLHTVASAARYLSLFDYDRFHESAYELLEITEGAEKQRGNHFFIYTLKEVQGLELVLSYLLDNVGYLTPDEWFLYDTISMADLLANRRAFRTFDKLQDNQAELFMEHIKIDQMRVIATQPYRADAFKANFDSIRKFFLDHPENINSILDGRGVGRQWDVQNVTNLAKFSVPMFLQLNGEGTAFSASSLAATMNAIAPVLLDYSGGDAPEGEDKAEVASTQMEFILQALQVAGKMLDKPVDFSKHMDFEESDLDTVANKFYNYTKSDRNGGYLTFSGLLSKLEIAGQTINIAQELDLVMREAPASLYSIPQEILANHHRTIIKGLTKLTSMDTIIKSAENIIDNTDMIEPQDEDEYVNDNTEMGDASPDDDDYDELRAEAEDKARDKVERLNQIAIETNTKCLRALEMLQMFIGEEEEDEEDDDGEMVSKPIEFGYQTPQFTPEIFEEYSSEILELRERLKETINERTEIAEDYRSTAGY